MLQDLSRIARRAGVTLDFDPQVKRTLVEQGYRPECGARELHRTIKTTVETPLTDLLLDGSITDGMEVRVSVRGGDVHFEPRVLATTSPNEG